MAPRLKHARTHAGGEVTAPVSAPLLHAEGNDAAPLLTLAGNLRQKQSKTACLVRKCHLLQDSDLIPVINCLVI